MQRMSPATQTGEDGWGVSKQVERGGEACVVRGGEGGSRGRGSWRRSTRGGATRREGRSAAVPAGRGEARTGVDGVRAVAVPLQQLLLGLGDAAEHLDLGVASGLAEACAQLRPVQPAAVRLRLLHEHVEVVLVLEALHRDRREQRAKVDELPPEVVGGEQRVALREVVEGDALRHCVAELGEHDAHVTQGLPVPGEQRMSGCALSGCEPRQGACAREGEVARGLGGWAHLLYARLQRMTRP